MDETKYSELIKSIQKKRKVVIVLTVIAVISILLFATPTKVEILEETVIDFEGLHPVLIAVLVILCFFIELVAYAIVSLPLNTSMEQECDPEKQLILNQHLNKQKSIEHIYAVDYLYLGDFEECIKHSENMINSDNKQMILAGLFNKARCGFFLGENELLKESADRYEKELLNFEKANAKLKIAYAKISNALILMCAISEKDTVRIQELYPSLECWNTSAATEGFVNYIKGLSAYSVEDKEEAIYRFKLVLEKCSKTVLAKLSEEYLALLK